MDDLSTTLNQILSDPQSMNQIKSIMDSMGLGGGAPQNNAPPPAASSPAAASTAGALASLLGNTGGSQQNSAPASGGLDSLLGGANGQNALGALTSLLGNSSAPQSGTAPASGGLDSLLGGAGGQNALGALTSLLGNNTQQSPAPTAAPALGGIDLVSAITRIAPLLSQIQQEDDSTRLLHALRPMLSAERQKKVDEAMRIIRLLRLAPLLKETGILGSLFG